MPPHYRRKMTCLIYAVTFGSLTALPTFADPTFLENNINLTNNDSLNTLTILQEPTSSGNTVRVTLSGQQNGAVSQSFQLRPTWFSDMQPGTIEQRGNGHTTELAVSGIGNLFAISQSGQSNRTTGQISGRANQASVIQSGQANRVSFTQTGTNNTIAISQSM